MENVQMYRHEICQYLGDRHTYVGTDHQILLGWLQNIIEIIITFITNRKMYIGIDMRFVKNLVTDM